MLKYIMTDMVEPYMLSLITTPIIQPQENIILKKQPEPITNSGTILGIQVMELKGYGSILAQHKQQILITYYLINLSKMDKDSFLKLCENNNVKYPTLRVEKDSYSRWMTTEIEICTKWNQNYIVDEIIEKFKKSWSNLSYCSAPMIHSLYSRYFGQIIKHISISPHYIDEYVFAIVYSNMCNLTKFIGNDD
jgi:hypothetical protein